MFRIQFMVEDKHLPEVLKRLAGYALNMEVPQPVENAIVKNGKVRQASVAGVPQPMLVLGQLLQKGKKVGDVVLLEEIKQAIAAEGIKPGNLGNICQRLKENGALRGVAKGRFMLEKVNG